MGEYDNYEDVRERLQGLRAVDLPPERAQAIADELKRESAPYKSRSILSLIRRVPKVLGPTSAALALSAAATAVVLAIVPGGLFHFHRTVPTLAVTNVARSTTHLNTKGSQTGVLPTRTGTNHTGSRPSNTLSPPASQSPSGSGAQNSSTPSHLGTTPGTKHPTKVTTKTPTKTPTKVTTKAPTKTSKPTTGISGPGQKSGSSPTKKKQNVGGAAPPQTVDGGGRSDTSPPSDRRGGSGRAGRGKTTAIGSRQSEFAKVKVMARKDGVSAYVPKVGLLGDSLPQVEGGTPGYLGMTYKDFAIVESTSPQPLMTSGRVVKSVRLSIGTGKLITETSVGGQVYTVLYFQLGSTYISIRNMTDGGAVTLFDLRLIAESLQAVR